MSDKEKDELEGEEETPETPAAGDELEAPEELAEVAESDKETVEMDRVPRDVVATGDESEEPASEDDEDSTEDESHAPAAEASQVSEVEDELETPAAETSQVSEVEDETEAPAAETSHVSDAEDEESWEDYDAETSHVSEAEEDDEEDAEESWEDYDAEDEEHALPDVVGPEVLGVAAFFDHPHHLLYAASQARDADYDVFDAYSPFPIHGMDDAMGLGRSWIPWVTFGAGLAGLFTAASLQFGIMGFDWPMIYGGKPYLAWPSFVPVMFELTVLFAGVTTALVMLWAAGCFRKPFIIDPEVTNDQFVLWISSDDEQFERDGVIEFMKGLNPHEIRTIKKDA